MYYSLGDQHILEAILIGIFIAWLVAEFRAGKWLRIGLGLVLIIGVVYDCHFDANRHLRRNQRRLFNPLVQIESLIQDGKQETVLRAIDSYRKNFSDVNVAEQKLMNILRERE